MMKKGLQRFILNVVLPSILAITLFIIAISVFIIPSFEKNIMDRKKEMISQLTYTAWSLIDEYHQEYISGTLSLKESQQLAKSKIKKMRYGAEQKDYFWIIDTIPSMIMHPYREELNGQNLSNYRDKRGKKLFVEAANLVKDNNEGYLDYMWQWKDDSTKIVPKLSYVKKFPEWGWIIGTGIYLEDVKEEIATINYKLVRISFLITIVIIILILFIVRQSLFIERRRQEAIDKLTLSQQKYKTLVEASTDGTLMFINDRIIYSNQKFSKYFNDETIDIHSKRFEDLFELDWKEIKSSFEHPDRSKTYTTRLILSNNTFKDIILSISKVIYANQEGFIIFIRDITLKERLEDQIAQLTHDHQTTLLLQNQPIKNLVRPLVKCNSELSIQEVINLMVSQNTNIVFIEESKQIIGYINESEIIRQTLASNIDLSQPIKQIMLSQVKTINENAFLYEAVLQFNDKTISHLLVHNSNNDMVGIIDYIDTLEIQRNTLSVLIKEVEDAQNISALELTYKKLPVLVNVLLDSSDKAENITPIITSLNDAVMMRVIHLTIEKIGVPPCKFALLVLGSEGRMEQTLSTDQDNAIVFEDVDAETEKKAYVYFEKFGSIVNDHLNDIGIKYCIGEIMMRNTKWSQPLTIWKKYFSDWISNSTPQNVLDASLFFDFRCVYGDTSLSSQLREFINNKIINKSIFLYHLAHSIINTKIPIGIFGQILVKNEKEQSNQFDLKEIIMPIVGFTRIYAIQHKLYETNTMARADQLNKMGIINQMLYKELILSNNFITLLRFRTQATQLLQNNNNNPDNSIDISKLSDIEKAILKKVLNVISKFQTKLSFDFKGKMY